MQKVRYCICFNSLHIKFQSLFNKYTLFKAPKGPWTNVLGLYATLKHSTRLLYRTG